jgi:hypothetical protein
MMTIIGRTHHRIGWWLALLTLAGMITLVALATPIHGLGS